MFSHSCVEVIVSLIRVEFFGLNGIPIRSTSSDAHEDLQVRTRLRLFVFWRLEHLDCASPSQAREIKCENIGESFFAQAHSKLLRLL